MPIQGTQSMGLAVPSDTPSRSRSKSVSASMLMTPPVSTPLAMPVPPPVPTRANTTTTNFSTSTNTGFDGPDGNRRKQTLLTILGALQELSASEGVSTSGSGPNGQRIVEEETDPTIDDSLQNEGGESFKRFETRIKALEKELRNFANATRQLGSSVGILSSAVHLRLHLYQILYLFRGNAAELFPRKVKKNSRDVADHTPFMGRTGGKTKRKDKIKKTGLNEKDNSHLPHHKYQHYYKQVRKMAKRNPHLVSVVPDDDLDPEYIPSLFKELAKELTRFLEKLNEFPEFSDEAVNSSIVAFEGDLNYWASTLAEFEGQLKFPTVGRYIHDLASEMGEHLDNITQSLAVFVEVGVPTIRFVQKHGASSLLNLTTVATFFSAVTATTLQFSFSSVETKLDKAVNTFWFSSLVFSIASAVNSLLGLTWKQAMYRSPGHRVPWWVLIWIKRSPLIFLVVSVVAFSVGLVLFSWSSNQSRITSIITTAFTALSSFGLVAVSLWFAFERWTYSRHDGQRWLADVLTDGLTEFRRNTGMEWLANVPPAHVRKATKRTNRALRRFSLSVGSAIGMTGPRRRSGGFGSSGNGSEEEEGLGPALPFSHADLTQQANNAPGTPGRPSQSHKHLSEGSLFTSEPLVMSPESEKTFLPSPIIEGESTDTLAATATPPVNLVKARWERATRMAIMSKRLAGNATPRVAKRQLTTGSIPSADGRARRDSLEPYSTTQFSRIARVISTLKNLEVTQEFNVHQALVRHLQFSPDGKWLATCSWDRSSQLFVTSPDAKEPCAPHHRLLHPAGPAGQVAWSPDGSYLLTKLIRIILVWNVDGTCKTTIERQRLVQSLVWMPIQEGKEPAFMSVEMSAVCMIDIHGNVLASYELDRLELYDVAVTPDAKRFLGVASLIESKDKLRPAKARPEHRIIVYNFKEKSIESQVPVLNEVRDITLGSKDGSIALVSYENMAPPQLWSLQVIRGDVRLNLKHTYMPQKPILWAGASYFGGSDDQLVLCAGKGGDVHIWDRQSGRLLHNLHAQAQDPSSGDLTSIAWNPLSSGTFMLATGTHEGIVKIWTATLPPRADEDEDAEDDDDDDDANSRISSPELMLDTEMRVESPTALPEMQTVMKAINDLPASSSSSLQDDSGSPSIPKDKNKRGSRFSMQIRQLHLRKEK